MVKLAVLLVATFVIFGNVESRKKMVPLPPEKMGKLMQGVMQCAGQLGMNVGEVLQKKDRTNTDPKMKKFIHCAFVATGVASKDGDVKEENFLDIYPDNVNKNELREVMEQCKQSSGEPADKIHNFLKCYKEKTPVLINFLG